MVDTYLRPDMPIFAFKTVIHTLEPAVPANLLGITGLANASAARRSTRNCIPRRIDVAPPAMSRQRLDSNTGNSLFAVSFVSIVAQVFDPVVTVLLIVVTNLHTFGARAEKSFCYQLVHVPGPLNVVLRECNLLVPPKLSG